MVVGGVTRQRQETTAHVLLKEKSTLAPQFHSLEDFLETGTFPASCLRPLIGYLLQILIISLLRAFGCKEEIASAVPWKKREILVFVAADACDNIALRKIAPGYRVFVSGETRYLGKQPNFPSVLFFQLPSLRAHLRT